MTDYEQLIDDLRQADNLTADHKLLGVCAKAAAAIEALQAQFPKRGEIVRCRECKWYGIYYAKKDGTPDKRYRPSVCLRGKYAKRRDPDWFCADGERKVQDGNSR